MAKKPINNGRGDLIIRLSSILLIGTGDHFEGPARHRAETAPRKAMEAVNRSLLDGMTASRPHVILDLPYRAPTLAGR